MKITARDRLKLLAGASALILSSCGGGSGSSTPVSVSPPPSPPPPPPPPPPPTSQAPAEGLLRNKYNNNFVIGAALKSFQLGETDLSGNLAKSQFNSLTPEFELKPDIIAPSEGVFNFDAADTLVDWAIAQGMQVRGHALLWHEATPAYFLQGNRDQIRARLENYITTVVDHFKDRIQVWDVVNEVVSVDLFNGNNGVGPDRRTNWFDAVGNADYLDWAFLAARAADPNAQLFLNDYETENPQKRAWLLEIVQRLIDRGVPIDGIGHQFHLQLDTVASLALEAIDDVDNQFWGLVNHITEMDVNFYNNPGSCWETQTNCEADLGPTAPTDRLATQAQLLRDLFDGFEARSTVESVTMWGVVDSDSWLNDVPIERFNYPLLFDRDGNPKPAFLAITDDNYEIPT